MPIEIGLIEALFRYPVKSMRGEQLTSANMGWSGIDGDRRIAIRRLNVSGGFPWLSASKLPELVTFTPLRIENGAIESGSGDTLPTHVRTPEGAVLALFAEPFAADIARRYGGPVETMQLLNGIFDDASISLIAASTVKEICALAGTAPDVRRFRPNILVRTARAIPFEEDQWVGGVLTFGDGPDAPAVSITMRDLRCSMVNFDPDGGRPTPEVMQAAVRANDNYAGIYCTVTRAGHLAVGQRVVLHR
jgi:uncharacterized protein YcbX